MDDRIRSHRQWLKDSIRKTVEWNATGQSRGLPPPPAQKPVPPNARTVALPSPDRFDRVCTAGLLRVLRSRRSIRRFADTPLSLEELAFLLWATQGVTERHGDEATFRLIPNLSESSAGGELRMPGLIQLGGTIRVVTATHPTDARRVTS
jgi:hypothetical protein